MVSNPKLYAATRFARSDWYPYYAGYSPDFVSSVLSQTNLLPESIILDPWNGSGTTTAVASVQGFKGIGLDLNPAMAVVASSRLLPSRIVDSLFCLQQSILDVSLELSVQVDDDDPLLDFFSRATAMAVRNIERAIGCVLGNPVAKGRAPNPLQSFFLLALFRTVRELLGHAKTRNPTWIRDPSKDLERKAVTRGELFRIVETQASLLANQAVKEPASYQGDCRIEIADSRALPIKDDSVGAVITSPPYCTRIDYAVKTRPELAVLGIKSGEDFDTLRRFLLGTTVSVTTDGAAPASGEILDVLRRIRSHESKASASYYYNTFKSYFYGLAVSLKEISRVLVDGGEVFIVVQDSYYKDIHVDLAGLVSSEFELLGLREVSRWEFSSPVSMRRMNSRAKSSQQSVPVESVLRFIKKG